MNWLGFGGTPLDIEITLSNQDQLRQVLGKNEAGEIEPLFLLTAGDNVVGTAVIKYKGKKVEHLGIKIELIGQIGQHNRRTAACVESPEQSSTRSLPLVCMLSAEFMHDAGNPHEFTQLERPLEEAGDITADKSYNFEFLNVDKPYETYNGNNVRLRYFLRVKVARSYSSNIVKTLDLAVQNLQTEPELNHGIKMEVGIEDCLHIEVRKREKHHANERAQTTQVHFSVGARQAKWLVTDILSASFLSAAVFSFVVLVRVQQEQI